MNQHHLAREIEVGNRNELMALALRSGFNAFLPVFYDDGIDFILHRRRDNRALKVQLKSRWTIERKYRGRDIWIAFRARGVWYIAPHDEMMRAAPASFLESSSWREKGIYHTAAPSRDTLEQLARFRITETGWMDDEPTDDPSSGRPDASAARAEAFEALDRWRRSLPKQGSPLTVDEILEMRDEGRR